MTPLQFLILLGDMLTNMIKQPKNTRRMRQFNMKLVEFTGQVELISINIDLMQLATMWSIKYHKVF